MTASIGGIADKFRETPVWARVLAGGALLSLLVSFLVWRLLLAGPGGDMAPLFSDLTLEDASGIQAYLEERRIPHRIGSGGDLIEVPVDRVHSLRLELASEGLPSRGAVGFELMDSLPWGATDFERHVSYIRALQGELERTIEGFEEVRRARVHVVLPRESVFISQKSPATAAVFLEMRPLARLDTDAVRGVIHLVASSVEGLSPTEVTVVDTGGIILSDRALREDAPNESARDSMEVQLQFEESLRSRLQGMLEQVLGPGNVAVQVSAQLNFDDREVHREFFEPVAGDGGLVIDMHMVEEEFSGTQAAPETGAGADSNLPSYQSWYSDGESSYQRSELTQNVVVNRTTEHWRVAPGAVERLSVAVVVNGAITPEQEEVLGDVVSAALGSDGNRNDSVMVTGMAFDTSLADQLREHMDGGAPPVEGEPGRIPPLFASRYVTAAVAAALAAGVLLLVYRRRTRDVLEEEFVFGEDEETVIWPSDGDVAQRRDALLEAIAHQGNGLRSTAAEMAEENPAKVAELLRTWLAEGSRAH